MIIDKKIKFLVNGIHLYFILIKNKIIIKNSNKKYFVLQPSWAGTL